MSSLSLFPLYKTLLQLLICNVLVILKQCIHINYLLYLIVSTACCLPRCLVWGALEAVSTSVRQSSTTQAVCQVTHISWRILLDAQQAHVRLHVCGGAVGWSDGAPGAGQQGAAAGVCEGGKEVKSVRQIWWRHVWRHLLGEPVTQARSGLSAPPVAPTLARRSLSLLRELCEETVPHCQWQRPDHLLFFFFETTP